MPAASNEVAEVVLGNEHACARLRDGRVSCWGEPDLIGSTPHAGCTATFCPPQFVGITDAVGISAGFANTCVVRANGKVSCWGLAAKGLNGSNPSTKCTQHLGVVANEPVTDVTVCDPKPVDIANLDDAVAVAIGLQSACAVRKSGLVACWGGAEVVSGTRSACASPGEAAPPAQCVLSATNIDGVAQVVEAAVGDYVTCVRRADGGVSCWGFARNGELGDGVAAAHTSTKAQPVVDLGDAVQLTASRSSFCARTGKGGVMCWGDGDDTGHGSAHIVPVRAADQPLSGASDLWGTQSVTCASRSDGAWCWGQVRAEQHLVDVAASPCPGSSVVCGGGAALHMTSPATKRFLELTHACSLGSDGAVHCAWPGHPELENFRIN